MKVLYISYDGMTDPLGRSQVLPYLEELAQKGHNIHLLSFEKKEQYASDEYKKVDAILHKRKIQWHPLPFFSKPPLLSKILDIRKLYKKSTELQKKHHFDLVHCRSYISALAGLKLKADFGVKFLFDMRGFWADERVEGGIWNLKNPAFKWAYHYFKKQEKIFFAKADAIVSLTHKGKEIISSQFGKACAQKTFVIPCCADTQLFDPSNISHENILQKKKALGIQESYPIVSYLGSTGTWYLLDEMLLFFIQIKAKFPKAKFLFITGDPSSLILEKAAEMGVRNEDIIIRKSDREDVPLHLAMSELSVYFIKPVFSKQASSPTKQAEILSMGIPVVCNAGVGDAEQIMLQCKSGLLLKELNIKSYQKAVNQIGDLIANNKPQDTRNKAIELFSLESGVETYHGIYNKMVTK